MKARIKLILCHFYLNFFFLTFSEELKKCKKTIADLQAEKENVLKELQEAEMENKM